MVRLSTCDRGLLAVQSGGHSFSAATNSAISCFSFRSLSAAHSRKARAIRSDRDKGGHRAGPEAGPEDAASAGDGAGVAARATSARLAA